MISGNYIEHSIKHYRVNNIIHNILHLDVC